MPSKRELIRNKAVELIKNNPRGLRYSDLQHKLEKCFPRIAPKNIPSSFWDLHITRSKEIYKPTKGLFKYRFPDEDKIEEEIEKTTKKSLLKSHLKEEDFYEIFASYIKGDLGECTEASALGGNYLGKKWGTPDVIGIYKSSTRDTIKFQPEIVSAELKIIPTDPVTAFGQAIAYRLFSSKVYLVEPNTISGEDLERIEALCMLFGVGLILFDLDPKNPKFTIRVRAQRYAPDMFFVNKFAEKLYNTKKDIFNKLF